jgi:uracil-DNA glycosylase
MQEKYTSFNHLQWALESGQDEILNEVPQNRFSNTQSIVKNADLSLLTGNVSLSENKSLFNVKPGEEIANAAKTLFELREAFISFEGCALKNTAMNLVYGDGNAEADVMLIGEAPGADEDREGKPFVGLSGQLLDKMIHSIGLSRSEVYVTNILPWRPPGNRQPTPGEIGACLPFVKRHIELVKPRILVLVGGTSAKTLLSRTEGIMRLRGRWFNYQADYSGDSIPAIPILHPAFLLRAAGQKANAWKDMVAIRKKMKGLEVY